MTKDRLQLVATAGALLAALFAAILFPIVRSTLWYLLIAAACSFLLMLIGGIVFLIRFNRAVRGPKSLTGSRCPTCKTRRAMRETDRIFLRGNVKFHFDHYQVEYCCGECGHNQQQEEHLDSQSVAA